MKNRKTAGIICEYNPFHNGHAYQTNEIRKRGYDTVIAVMSGNTVQRGEFAITDKYTRAKCALLGGVDLVIELPYPYSASSTEYFATAGVRLLSSVGADSICFGSECGDPDKLESCARLCSSPEFEQKYRELSTSSFGTASAYFEAYKCLSGSEMPDGANDILGIAYLKAIIAENLSITPEIIKRAGSSYRDDDITAGDIIYPSARMIREEISRNGIKSIPSNFIPSKIRSIISSSDISQYNRQIERSILSFFRLSSPEELAAKEIAEAGGGLAEKLCKMSHAAHSYKEFVELAAEKKYTFSRINRAIIHCMTGVTENDVKFPPAYSTVLGFNSNGRTLLSELRGHHGIPLVTKPADAQRLSSHAARQSLLSYRADSLYSLTFDKVYESHKYTLSSPVIDDTAI